MDKVKSALSDFTQRSGHHDTTVHEAVAPAVTHETIKPHEHEEIHTAVDKEVHQDHYHRTVQPVKDREVLPETHQAKLGAVQHREFDHRDHDTTKRNLAQEQAQFKDERRLEGTTQSQSVAPTIGGEHVHHHIHETIQPVVNKETIQPNVVHTTVPIHEVHHNAATQHETTALPAMTMGEFQKKGGVLSGREERYDEFEGVPKNIGGGTAGGFGHLRDEKHSESGSEKHRHGDFDSAAMHQGDSTTGSGAAASGLTSEHRGSEHRGSEYRGSDSTTGRHVGTDGPIGSSNTSEQGTDELPRALTEPKSSYAANNESDHRGSSQKPGLKEKLNPKIDADGDGKAGFMS